MIVAAIGCPREWIRLPHSVQEIFLAYGRDVNKFRFSWAALSLLAPILLFCAVCFGPAACSSGGSSSPSVAATAGFVQAEFIANLTGISAASLQNFVINVTNIRMNPLPTGSKTATPSETSGKWVVIPAPTATASGAVSPGDVAVDMLADQSQMQIFNTVGLKNEKFNTVEVVLDTALPGFVVPQCAGANLEGCVKYPIQLSNPTGSLRFQFPAGQPFQTIQHETQELPILLSANVVSTPTGPGQPYVVDLSISDGQSPVVNPYRGIAQGTVKGGKGSNSSTHSHLKVNAELAGTNTVVATSDVLNGTFTLFLPAAIGSGTVYDFYVSGGTTTFAFLHGIDGAGTALLPGQTATLPDLQVTGNQTLGGFSGQITDQCTTLPINGATVQILEPISTSIDCTTTPESCISVASATTDSGGNYPIPGTTFSPAPFQQIPIGSPSPSIYVLQISAPGYNTLFMEGTAAQGGAGAGIAAGHCTTSPFPTGTATPANGTCTFSLGTSYIQGNVSVAQQPPGTKTTVQVVAEKHGTNSLVSALTTPLVIPGGGTNLGFTLNVPTQQNLDIFAVTEDLYQGAADPFPGHTILVNPGFTTAPTTCATASPNPVFTPSVMDCVGHGSISGIAANPDGNTTVELLKDGVAITQSSIDLLAPTATASASYSFCIPPDTYTLQRMETGTPTGTPAAVGAMATPSPINSPCPSTCFNPGGTTCPGICNNTAGPNM